MNGFLLFLSLIGVGLIGYGMTLQYRQKNIAAPAAAPVAAPAVPVAEVPPPPPVPVVAPPPVAPPAVKPAAPKPKKAVKKPAVAKKPAPPPKEKEAPPPPAAVAEPLASHDHEFDPKTFTNALPAPVATPPGVELPTVIAEEAQWMASQSGIGEPLQVVFRSEEAWRVFWEKAIAPYTSALSALPPIDFSKDMVVGVFMGNQTLAGFKVRIISTAVETGGAEKVLAVRYKNVDFFPGASAPRFQVQPFHLVRTRAFPGKVSFTQIKDLVR